jgi:hypothetical protein
MALRRRFPNGVDIRGRASRLLRSTRCDTVEFDEKRWWDGRGVSPTMAGGKIRQPPTGNLQVENGNEMPVDVDASPLRSKRKDMLHSGQRFRRGQSVGCGRERSIFPVLAIAFADM